MTNREILNRLRSGFELPGILTLRETSRPSLSKNELKRRERGLTGQWLPFQARPSDEIDDAARAIRTRNQRRNQGRVLSRKLSTNLKKLRRRLRKQNKEASTTAGDHGCDQSAQMHLSAEAT